MLNSLRENIILLIVQTIPDVVCVWWGGCMCVCDGVGGGGGLMSTGCCHVNTVCNVIVLIQCVMSLC